MPVWASEQDVSPTPARTAGFFGKKQIDRGRQQCYRHRTWQRSGERDKRTKTLMTGLLILLALAPFAAKAASLLWLANNYLAQSAYKILQLAAPLWWRRHVDQRRGLAVVWPLERGWPSATTWGLAVGIAAAAVGAAVVILPWLAVRLGIDAVPLRQDIDARFAMTPGRAALVVFFLSTWNAALEELHFRGWLDPELSRRFGDRVGIGGSAVAFAAMHLFIFANMRGATLLAMGLLFVTLAMMGVIWSLLARRPGGIHAAWLCHALTDAGLLTWGLFWLGYF